MLKNGKSFPVLGKIFISRPAELVFATGIPMVAFLCAVENLRGLLNLLWFYPVLLVGGWHVLAVNDLCFGRRPAADFLRGRAAVPIVAAPLVLLVFFFLKPGFAAVIFLVMLNWDVYSIAGKDRWQTSILHNFCGGALHCIAGIAGAGVGSISAFWPEFMFFAFAMTAGAIHHDACDCAEDAVKSYRTGAVVFGQFKWWKAGIIPMICAQAFLLFSSSRLFLLSFSAASALYFILYIITAMKNDVKAIAGVRVACRLIFLACAAAFAAGRIIAFFRSC